MSTLRARQLPRFRFTDIEMAMNYKPRDLMVWLHDIDVNGLSDADQDRVAEYDIDNDDDLNRLITDWLKPRYKEFNETSQASMYAVLEKSKEWSKRDLAPVFAEIAFPSGQEIKDIDRFMIALRKEILG